MHYGWDIVGTFLKLCLIRENGLRIRALRVSCLRVSEPWPSCVLQTAAAADTSGVENTAAFGSYETMVVLRPDLSDEQRDSELAKFEAFLRKHGAAKIDVTVRGRQRLAYPMKGFSDGIYVLYTFEADPSVVSPMQKMLSTPTAGAELNVLRHISFRV